MKIRADRSRLLVIDVQERLMPVLSGGEEAAAGCGLLLEAAGEVGVPALISEQYRKGLGPTVASVREKARNVSVMEKMHFSCMGDKAMAENLEAARHAGRGQIVLGGVEAHICVAQTALDLKAAGFEVFVAADACASRKPVSAETAFDRLRQNGVEVVTAEMVVFEWLEISGGDLFKRVSKLVK